MGSRVYQMDQEAIEDQGQGLSAGFDQIIIHAPGVAQDSSGQYHVRGEDAGLQYRINGILLPEGIWTTFGQQLDSHLISELSLTTGALPAQYGLRTAGVVELQTKSGSDLSGQEVSVYGGSNSTFRPSFTSGGVVGDTSYLFIGGYDQSDLGTNNATPAREAVHDKTRQYQGFSMISRELGEGGQLSFIFSGVAADFQIPNIPGLLPSFALEGSAAIDSSAINRNQDERNYYGIVAYTLKTPDLNIQLAEVNGYSSTHYLPDYVGDLLFTGVASDAQRALITNSLLFDLTDIEGGGRTIRGGFSVSTQAESTSTTNAFFPVDAGGSPLTDVPQTFHDKAHKRAYNYGSYLQEEWQARQGLTLNVGGRLDRVDGYVRQSQLSPRFNLTYAASAGTAFHAGYSWYFTPPQLEYIPPSVLNEYIGTTNSPGSTRDDVPPAERASYFDVGMLHAFAPGLQLGIDAYYKSIRNMQDETQLGSSLANTPFTYKYGYKEGVELTPSYDHGGWNAYINLAIAQTKGREINSSEGLFGSDELDYIAGHYIHVDHDQLATLSSGISRKFGATVVHGDVLYGSGMHGGFANTEKVPSHAIVNVGIMRQLDFFGRGLVTVRLDVVNLFDRSYLLHEEGIGITTPQYGARRGFFGGIECHY